MAMQKLLKEQLKEITRVLDFINMIKSIFFLKKFNLRVYFGNILKFLYFNTFKDALKI